MSTVPYYLLDAFTVNQKDNSQDFTTTKSLNKPSSFTTIRIISSIFGSTKKSYSRSSSFVSDSEPLIWKVYNTPDLYTPFSDVNEDELNEESEIDIKLSSEVLSGYRTELNVVQKMNAQQRHTSLPIYLDEDELNEESEIDIKLSSEVLSGYRTELNVVQKMNAQQRHTSLPIYLDEDELDEE